VRVAFVALLCVAALAAASSGASTPDAIHTRSCSQAGSYFNVQIAGNIDGTYVGRANEELFARIPRGQAMVAVWTFGSQENIDGDLYGWAAGSRADIAQRCRSLGVRAPSRGALRPALRVKDGWAYGRRYKCDRRGRIAIQTQDLAGGVRLTVWMEKSRELIAVAEIGRGIASVRASKRCDERSL
jgi:hypothetical protein